MQEMNAGWCILYNGKWGVHAINCASTSNKVALQFATVLQQKQIFATS